MSKNNKWNNTEVQVRENQNKKHNKQVQRANRRNTINTKRGMYAC